jgi:hypothetical protein
MSNGASNKSLDRSAVSALHMALAGKENQLQRARSALPLYAWRNERCEVSPRQASPAPPGSLLLTLQYCDKMCGVGGGHKTTARLLLNIAHNNCVQRSAASKSLNIASMPHAAPADAKR